MGCLALHGEFKKAGEKERKTMRGCGRGGKPQKGRGGGEQVDLGKRKVRWFGRLGQGHKRTEETQGY